MTNFQLRERTGLSQAELTCWINQGLVVPERTGASGRNPEFDAAQLPRIHVLRALHDKGVSLRCLASFRLDLAARFVVFDSGRESLRPCRDAAAAIGAVLRPKKWCSAVDLAAIRSVPAR